MRRPPLVPLVIALAVLVTTSAAACASDAGSGESSATLEPATSVTTELPMDSRSQLSRRLTEELGDAALAEQVVAGLNDGTVAALEKLAGGDIPGSPKLAYRPTTTADDDVDSLWVFSYGYRIAPGAGIDGVEVGGVVPPMDQLEPGPTNEELARQAAAFVAEHPVPIIAQWEVAQVLQSMGVQDVISVEPDIAEDGTVTYLSTAGVATKGLQLAADQGITPGHAGVLCFADHAVRCLLTARQAGLEADVPEGVELPSDYDAQSGQIWTRDRATWIPVDLLGRSVMAG